MTIKFSDETIKEGQRAFCEAPYKHDGTGIGSDVRARAAVFEAAANAQVNARDDVKLSSPFQIGKRYRVGVSNHDAPEEYNGTVGRVDMIAGPSEVLVSFPDGGSAYYQYSELIPGEIIDSPPEIATAVAMTDYALANELWTAYGKAPNEPDGWLAAAQRARELLQTKHDETDACLIADLKRDQMLSREEERKAEQRAERAEAAIERARSCVESGLRMTALNDFQRGFDEALKTICTVAGFTITPARELTVTWEK